MPEPVVLTATLAFIERIAGAIREELGEAIDTYPGCRSPEGADPINRSFRAVVRSLLECDRPSAVDPTPLVSRTLRQVAERRLTAEGWDDGQVKVLIEEEPGGPDDWLCFVRRVTSLCIPFPERRPSGNGPGLSDSPTTERYGGP